MLGLRPGTYDESHIKQIARLALASNGNCRFALDVLWRTARASEDKGLDSINDEELNLVVERLGFQSLGISPEELLIIELLKKGPIDSSRLYALFRKRLWKSKRQIRNYISQLEEKGIIGARITLEKYNFGSRVISLRKGWEDG
jgi:Cdc6-like AAA superfamily ATPase